MTERILAAATILCALFCGGCERIEGQRSRRQIERAESEAASGDARTAVNLYESALDGTPETAEIHYRIAILYDDKLKDPVAALAHFQRYLALAPHGKFAADARGFAKEDELKALTLLSKGSLINEQDSARVRNENLELRRLLSESRARAKAMAVQMPVATQTPGEEPQQKPIPPGARTYVVKSGDTLAAISRKFYNTPVRWKDIQDANFNKLEGTVKLKPGQRLLIPQ